MAVLATLTARPHQIVLLAAAASLGLSCNRFEQSEICAAYLECLAEVYPTLLGDAIEDYGPEGDCWFEDQTVADLCYRSCSVALEQAHLAFPDVDECPEQ